MPFLAASIVLVAISVLAALIPAIISTMLVARWPESAEILSDVDGYDYHAVQFEDRQALGCKLTEKDGRYPGRHTRARTQMMQLNAASHCCSYHDDTSYIATPSTRTSHLADPACTARTTI